MFGNAVRLYGGNVQVHAPGYRERANQMPMLPVENPDGVIQMALTKPHVTDAFKRINTTGHGEFCRRERGGDHYRD